MDGINRRSLLAIAAMVFSVPMAVGQSPQIDRPGYETLPPGQVFGIVGRNVTGSDGADAGRQWDVLIERDGEPRAVVIDYVECWVWAGARSPSRGRQSASHRMMRRTPFA